MVAGGRRRALAVPAGPGAAPASVSCPQRHRRRARRRRRSDRSAGAQRCPQHGRLGRRASSRPCRAGRRRSRPRRRLPGADPRRRDPRPRCARRPRGARLAGTARRSAGAAAAARSGGASAAGRLHRGALGPSTNSSPRSGVAPGAALAALTLLELEERSNLAVRSSYARVGLHHAAKNGMNDAPPHSHRIADRRCAARVWRCRGTRNRAGLRRTPRRPSRSRPRDAPTSATFATNVAFSLAKTARASPQEIAAALVTEIQRRAPELRSDRSAASSGGRIHQSSARAACLARRARADPQRRRTLRRASFERRAHLARVRQRESDRTAGRRARPLDVDRRDPRQCDAVLRLRRIRRVDHQRRRAASSTRSGRSIYARYRQIFDPPFPLPEDGYPGEYLVPIARASRDRDGERWIAASESEWLPHFSKTGRDELVAAQEATAKRFGVTYDCWQSEAELHDSGKVREGIERLRELGLTYEEEGALFFRATQFRRRQRPRDRAQRRTPDLLLHGRRLSLSKAQAQRPRRGYSRPRPSRVHRAPERHGGRAGLSGAAGGGYRAASRAHARAASRSA